MPEKLLAKNLRDYREAQVKKNQNLCELCGHPIEDACLDHDHRTGLCRGVICRRCNSALGSVERCSRFGIKDTITFLRHALAYLEHHQVDRTNLTHPTHRTPEEKKERAKRRTKRRLAIRARSG